MKKEGALFDLIKSLTKSEKRFFKLYASRYIMGEKNSYVKLFEFIDKLNHYDEGVFRKRIETVSFSGNLRGVKNYLYFLILDCLDIYHKDSSIDRRASKYINIARVLSDKRLDGQSNKMIEKARKLSDEFNRFENIIALNALHKITDFKRETISAEKIGAYYNENFSAIEDLRTKLSYNQLYDELHFKRLSVGLITSDEEKKKIIAEYKTHPFNKPPSGNYFDAHMYYLLAKIEYYRMLMDTDNGGIHIRKLLYLFEGNANRIADNVNHYIYALNVFISERVFQEKREEADSVLHKLISLPSLIGESSVSHDVKVQVFQIYYTLLTHIALIFRDYDNALPHIRKYESEKIKLEEFFTPSFRLCMQSNIACIYFGAGQLKLALKWCNIAMEHPPKTRDDVTYVVRILYLLTHFELGNQIILPNLIKSAQHYLHKVGRENKFTSLFFKHLKGLLRSESKKEQAPILLDFKSDLIKLREDKYESDIFDDIDLLGWVDAKLKGQ